MDYRFINTEYIESVSGGDYEIISELVELFIEQATEVSIEMRSLLKAGRNYDLGLLAHKAKSSVAIMGMADLAAMLKTFELDAKVNKEPEKYESYIVRYENETGAAVEELRDFVAKQK